MQCSSTFCYSISEGANLPAVITQKNYIHCFLLENHEIPIFLFLFVFKIIAWEIWWHLICLAITKTITNPYKMRKASRSFFQSFSCWVLVWFWKSSKCFLHNCNGTKSIQSHGWLCNIGNSFITKITGLGCKTFRFKHSQLTHWLSHSCHSTYICFSLDLSNLLWEDKSQASPPLFYLSRSLYFCPLFPLPFSEFWKDFFPILVFSS